MLAAAVVLVADFRFGKRADTLDSGRSCIGGCYPFLLHCPSAVYQESNMYSRCLLCLVAMVLSNFCHSEVQAQNSSPEFIESSSPLSNGDRVISRSEEGRAVQTVITVSAESLARRSEESQRDRVDLTAQRQQSQSAASNVPTPSANESQVNPDRYPYPAANRVANNATFRSPAAARGASTGYQLPTLGIGNLTTARRAQLYQDCNCNPQTFGFGRPPVPATQIPSLQVQPPALNIQEPGQVGAYQQPFAYQQPAVQQPYFNGATQPQFGFQNNNRWWTPFVTGSGVYQPIVRLANIKPGTYLGQGIIGQPTAYVDGQPIRNLMRYIFP